LLAVSLYQGNPDMKQALEYRIYWEVNSAYAGAAGMLLLIIRTFANNIVSFVVKSRSHT